ncbi:gluconokinase [Yeosuana marina]|uniref:gluconokinase n=1 Tax=Yeosuana marina TaxID=1565536 RepID=UPI0030C7DE43
MVIILMGVSGSGKTSVGKQLSKQVGVPFFDADDFHPQSNIDKMSNNMPLNDDDRTPWLEALAMKIDEWQTTGGAILACSALKESYRKILSSGDVPIFWVFLSGSFELIQQRMKTRTNHYMKPELLQSQFDALEIPDYGLQIDIQSNINDITNEIISKINTNA